MPAEVVLPDSPEVPRAPAPHRKQRTIIELAVGVVLLALLGFWLGPWVTLLIVAFVSGAPLFTIMLGAAALGAMHLSGQSSQRPFSAEFDGMVEHMLNVGLGDQVQVMSTIPLFIYAGYLLAEAGTADRLVRFANALLGWVPGGLAIVTIGTCALFTVFTGASGVTIIALGGVLLPALVKQGYPKKFSMGLIAGTGSVGLLFPPALPLFIYGTIYGLTNLSPETWDTRRFLFAGIVPGLVLIGMLSAVAVTVAVVKKLPRQKFSMQELVTSALIAGPELIIPFGVILCLALGFDLPQVAALTVVYTAILELGVSRIFQKIYPQWGKPLPAQTLWNVTREAMAMVGAIFIIIFASTTLTNFMVTADVPGKLVHWTQDHVGSKVVFLLALNVILLIVGTVMDIFSAIVVVLPLVAPIAQKYGVDPYHLGVIFLLNLEVGYLHPPVGLNLFITSVKFQRPVTEVMWATIPFLLTMIAALLLVTYVPQLTVVPEAERVGRVQDLATDVHTRYEELSVVRQVTLVDASGTPLSDKDGKPMVKHLSECDAITNEIAKGGCQQLFFGVKDCKADQTCKNKAIAKWVVANINGGDDVDKQIVLVQEVTLPNGTVKKIADCAKSNDVDTCRELFLNVSNCKLDPPDKGVDVCTKDAISTWVDANSNE
ncbi:MAG TPA: TRAP transporter large permease [Kofleriaceae bacterium]|jgi:tripartite ATP-independent transporter DctM subunit